MGSIEIPLPDDVLDSLPDLGGGAAASNASTVTSPPAAERRSTEALVKKVTVPLTVSSEELRQHRNVRLEITLDITVK